MAKNKIPCSIGIVRDRPIERCHVIAQSSALNNGGIVVSDTELLTLNSMIQVFI
jgi:hypothetical protein